MKKIAPLQARGGVLGSIQNADINYRHPTAQDHQNKPRVIRAAAPPLGACYHPDTVTNIIEMVALHLRRTIPALANLTIDDFEIALGDLRQPLGELLHEHED
jgi:hypothetical protein